MRAFFLDTVRATFRLRSIVQLLLLWMALFMGNVMASNTVVQGKYDGVIWLIVPAIVSWLAPGAIFSTWLRSDFEVRRQRGELTRLEGAHTLVLVLTLGAFILALVPMLIAWPQSTPGTGFNTWYDVAISVDGKPPIRSLPLGLWNLAGNTALVAALAVLPSMLRFEVEGFGQQRMTMFAVLYLLALAGIVIPLNEYQAWMRPLGWAVIAVFALALPGIWKQQGERRRNDLKRKA